jgi:hypothetical protein
MLALGSMATGVAMVVVQSVTPEVLGKVAEHKFYEQLSQVVFGLLGIVLLWLGQKLWPVIWPMLEFFLRGNKPVPVVLPARRLNAYEQYMYHEVRKAKEGHLPTGKPPTYLS